MQDTCRVRATDKKTEVITKTESEFVELKDN